MVRFCTLNHFLEFVAEKALATLQSRNIPDLQISVPLVLSPYPPTNPPTPLPPPSAMPRLVKQLPLAFTDSQLYDLFRPYGALASARTPTQFGPDTGMVEFWNEEDAQMAEDALHCAEVEGQNIVVQLYQPRRSSHSVREFNAAPPSFVPAPVNFSPFHPQVNIGLHSNQNTHDKLYSIHPLHVRSLTLQFDHLSRYLLPRLFMDQVRRFNWHPYPAQDLIVTAASSIPVTYSLR